jgi:DNA-binding GntR family transcriptional regulator
VTKLVDLAARIRATPDNAAMRPEDWFALDNTFLHLVILSTPNTDLAHYVSANRSALEASQRVLFSIGLPPDRQSLMELCMVIDLLLAGTSRAAASMMVTHLENALNRTIAQLKIVSVIDPPENLAAYLAAD